MIKKSGIARAVVWSTITLMPVVTFGGLEPATGGEDIDSYVRESKSVSPVHPSDAFATQADNSSGFPLSSASVAGQSDKKENRWFVGRLFDTYMDEFKGTAPVGNELPHRALPSPWNSPLFPMSEYKGLELVGVPVST